MLLLAGPPLPLIRLLMIPGALQAPLRILGGRSEILVEYFIPYSLFGLPPEEAVLIPARC